MRRYVTEEQLTKLANAHNAVSGTLDYAKYLMCMEYKYVKEGKWTPWTYVSWSIPTPKNNNEYYFKKVKDNIYIMIEYYGGEMERYIVTPAVKELLNL